MVRITAYVEMSDEDAARFKDDADLESSFAARLDEVYDGNGNPVSPKLLGIEVENDG